MSTWTTQTPVTDQTASAVNGTVSLYEPACVFGSDPPGGTVGYWGRYPDQDAHAGLYNLAPAALRVFDSASGTKTIEAKITSYGGVGGPGDGRSKHRVGFASLDMASAFFLEWENTGLNLCVRESGVAFDDDVSVASTSFSAAPSASHPVWLRLTLVVGASITADFSETDRASWVAMPGIPAGTGTEFTPSQYVIALHTVSQGMNNPWPDGSVTYSNVVTDEDALPNNSLLNFDEDQGELEEGNGYCHLITDLQDNELGTTGHLRRDYTAASRCVFRLLCRRGEYLADPTMGSRFHTIKTIKADEALGICRAMAKEALKPLIDSGDIDSVSVDDVLHDPETGRLSVSLSIVAAGDRVELGAFPLGSWRS